MNNEEWAAILGGVGLLALALVASNGKSTSQAAPVRTFKSHTCGACGNH